MIYIFVTSRNKYFITADDLETAIELFSLRMGDTYTIFAEDKSYGTVIRTENFIPILRREATVTAQEYMNNTIYE